MNARQSKLSLMRSHVGSKEKWNVWMGEGWWCLYKVYNKGYDSPKPGFQRREALMVMARVREAGFISMIWKREWYKDGKGFAQR